MAGVNSLGIGSGVLTADLLDQLREADNAAILKPIETKLELSTQKEDAYNLLSGFMTTFKQSTATLGGENMYQGRQVEGNDDFVSMSAVSGSDLQSVNITEVVKAEKDVWSSTNTFSDTSTALLNLGAGTLTVSVGGVDLDIEYTPATTLDDIRIAINDGTGIEVTASNLKIGDDAYSFSLSADNLNEAITFTDTPRTEQLNKITLTGNAVDGDTFSWSDGTNSLSIPLALVAGETPDQTGIRIADAINADANLNTLYTATAVEGGFTIESKTPGTLFSGTATSTGTQTSSEVALTPPNKQLDTITLTGDAAADGLDTFSWSDGVNSLVDFPLLANETPTDAGIRIAQAINDDPALNALYTATAVDGGFSIEAKNLNQEFISAVTSTGTQTSSSATTIEADLSLEHTLGFNDTVNANIQVAREASFKMNGISITRSTNTIDDLVNGVTISLNKNHGATDSSAVKITQNDTTIKTEMDLFVTNFNTLTSNLKDMTVYNPDSGVAGIFNSESFVKSITSGLTNIINKTDSSGNSLYDYGVEISRDGVMSLDSSKFSTKLGEDPDALELLFRGASAVDATETTSATNEVIGIFQELDEKMFTYTGSNQLLLNFNQQLSDSKKNLISEYDKQKASLDVRYETLTKKFGAYDSLINKLNNQFSSLKLLIDAESNSDS